MQIKFNMSWAKGLFAEEKSETFGTRMSSTIASAQVLFLFLHQHHPSCRHFYQNTKYQAAKSSQRNGKPPSSPCRITRSELRSEMGRGVESKHGESISAQVEGVAGKSNVISGSVTAQTSYMPHHRNADTRMAQAWCAQRCKRIPKDW